MRVFISAAEPSGDRIAAGLVESLKKRRPHWHFGGIVGPKLRDFGVEAVADISALSVMGLWEVLPKALSIWRLQRRIRRELSDWDAVITVDSSSFNRPLLRAMKRICRPAIGVVSPQVWATRPHRAQQLPHEQDQLLCLFNFEPPLYPKDFAVHVGHPVIDELVPRTNHQTHLFGLLPGSRAQEIKRHLPIFLEAAAIVRQQIPAARFLISTPQPLTGLPQHVHWVTGGARQMNAVQAALTKSGTITLELARMGIPMIVAHKVSLLTWWIGKRLLICPWVALPNILSKARVVPEYLQHLDAQILANELISVQEQHVDLSPCGEGGAFEQMANHCERIILRHSHTGQML